MSGEIGERIRLRSGAAEAEIGTVAAVIAGLRVGGVELTEPIPEGTAPAMCNGIHLSPWPNRVRDGRWTHAGTVQQLDITEPDRNMALHGLLQFVEFTVLERAEDRVRLGAFVAPQHGWPFPLEVEVEYTAMADGLRVRHTAINRGTEPAPYATGSHPYLRIGDEVADLRITVPAPRYIETDDRLGPVGVADVEGTPADLRHGPVVSTLDLDTAYAGVELVDGASAWLERADGAKLELLQDADWHYAQVFTTTIFPGPDGLKPAIAVEPMTAPPDALNSGEGLVWIAPGERWSGELGLRYTPPGL